ncbi:hypothetical protein [Thermococcus sp.]|uniref:hypothetical protein n=1 Tax=Thermococcus sp. TaxID=35749 RepID=UPI0025CFD801|nr:hypothetical protein [Thermococcus sp.]
MRRNAKRKLIPLAFALVLTIIGTALAVPRISVSVQKIGGGANNTVAVDTTKAAVNWIFDSAQPWVITGANVSLDNGPGVNGTLTLYISLDNGTVYTWNASISSTDTSVTVSAPSGEAIDLTQNYIEKVTVVINGKQVSVS